jgi:hypothetical protein
MQLLAFGKQFPVIVGFFRVLRRGFNTQTPRHHDAQKSILASVDANCYIAGMNAEAS